MAAFAAVGVGSGAAGGRAVGVTVTGVGWTGAAGAPLTGAGEGSAPGKVACGVTFAAGIVIGVASWGGTASALMGDAAVAAGGSTGAAGAA
jgi:hypothetical protein